MLYDPQNKNLEIKKPHPIRQVINTLSRYTMWQDIDEELLKKKEKFINEARNNFTKEEKIAYEKTHTKFRNSGIHTNSYLDIPRISKI
jgi:hypothetical protein